MRNVMLGPLPAAAGEPGAGAAAPGTGVSAGEAGAAEEFMAIMAALLGRIPSGAEQPQAQTDETAPGPSDGKVPEEPDADAAGLTFPPGLARHAACAATAARSTLAVDPHAAGPRSPRAAEPAGRQVGPAFAPPAAPAPWAPPVPEGGQRVPGSAGAGASGEGRGAPAAVVSLTIARAEAAPAGAAAGPPPAAGPPLAAAGPPPAAAGPPPAAVPAAEDGAPPSASPQVAAPPQPSVPPDGEGAPAPAGEPERPAPDAAGAAAAPPPSAPGRTGETGLRQVALPAHEPRQLAHELVGRIRMAVRAEGREIQLHLRPPDLGQLAIRVVVHDGVLQAHIAADRPEAARLLEQSLGHLQDILAERGYELGSVDVEAGGPEAGGAGSGAAGDPGGDRRGRGRADGPQEPAGTPAPVAAPVHGGDVDLLA